LVFEVGKRFTVFSITEGEDGKGTIWTRAGNATINKDGSMNVWLEVFPRSGRLHVREAVMKRNSAPEQTPALEPQPLEAAVGGH
jgi:hypothetical protein